MTKPAAARGRPAHKPSERNCKRIALLAGMGWSARRIANGVGLDAKTLRRRYSRELEARDSARNRMDAEIAMTLWQQFQDGSTSAGKAFMALLDKIDLMIQGQLASSSETLGKKARALLLAGQSDPNSPLGQVLLRRQARASETPSAPSADDEVDRWAEGEPPN